MRTVNSIQKSLPGIAAPGRAGMHRSLDAPIQREPADNAAVTDVWRLLWAKKWLIGLVTLLAVACGAGVAFLQRPLYTARTAIELEQLSDVYTSLRDSANAPARSAVDTYVEAQTRILQSDALAIRVAAKLDLGSKAGFRYAPGAAEAWLQNLGWKVFAAPSEQEELLRRIRKAVTVRPLPQARAIDIICRTPDPALSAGVCNTFAAEFADISLENRVHANEVMARWLGLQLEDLRKKLRVSGQSLQRYAAETGIRFDAENKDNLANEETRQLQGELSRAQADRMLRQSAYETAASAAPDALPQVLDNATLRGYQTNLTDLRRQMAELSAVYKPTHYKIVNLEAQIREIEAAIKRESDNVRRRIEVEFNAAKRREGMLVGAYNRQMKVNSQQAEKITAYNVLKREVDTTQQLYDTISQKVKEATVLSALRATNVHVVDPAIPPSAPSSPNLPLNAAIGLLSGMALGIGIVLVRSGVDTRVSGPGQARLLFQVPELGVIPSASAPEVKRLRKREPLALIEPPQDRDTELVKWTGAGAIISDSFRAVLTSLLLQAFRGERSQVIVITSVNKDEGKTTVSANLAMALAEIGRKVLVIDADLRAPRLHTIFRVSNSWGLTDLLSGDAAVQQIPADRLACRTEFPGLWVLPSGPGREHVLYSERVAELLATLRSQFDAVLVDTPPVGFFSEARVLGSVTDGVVLVVRATRTNCGDIKTVLQQLNEDNIPVLGTILNDWRPESSFGKYSAYSYYR